MTSSIPPMTMPMSFSRITSFGCLADPHRGRQSLGSQDESGGGVPAAKPAGSISFRPDLLLLAQPVEFWFARIQRDVIDRGVFTSVNDLAWKLRRYIRAYEKSARPFRWT